MSNNVAKIKRLFSIYSKTSNNQPYYEELVDLFLETPELLTDNSLTQERIILGLEYVK